MIILFGDYLHDARIHEKLGANIAWGHLAIYSSSFEGDSDSRSLCQCILLRMNRSDAVHAFMAIIMNHFVHLMSDLIAMRQADRGADISSDENSFILDDDASRSSSIASASRSYHLRDGHEIFIP